MAFTPLASTFPPRSAWLLLAASLLLTAGCKRDEAVIEKTEPIPEYEAAYPTTVEPVKIAIIGGIAPAGGGNQWIFFKMIGPAAEVEKQRPRFLEFIDSLVYQPDDDKMPFGWKTPQGWQRKPGDGFRMATFKTAPFDPDLLFEPLCAIGGSAVPVALEMILDATYPNLSVSKATGTMLANVNRWRAQVGVPPVEQVNLPRLITYRNVDGATIFLVEMAGPGPSAAKAMLPPNHPPVQPK